MKLSEKIQKILDSSITSYRISKITGVTVSSIGAMRRGERKVENMQLGIAEKLGQFYDEEMADMSMETIQIILSEAFKKIGVKPFIDTDDENVIIEFDLLGDDDPVRFAVYTSEITTKDDVLQNLGQALRDFDTQEEDGYYPSLYSDQATNPEPVTAEYMPISKESSDYLAGLGKKILNLE
ncbi:hypothetical protein FD33_GL000002 [Companilactobacillus paralimentarius DSM 13238 = JCM 10415]|uniref:Uncharacterized protein n=1 Tax=Companilactobacillus paralimentarius DSM 13238 = JCM 10415 TaxID=1122151 RepID=A0A0R1PKB6_9LACO|nr:hypothetical protein [Companilactobacillus paralimentarius]KAE9563250.1 hypothetical protein ATN96_11045 [Companilactobacillus paralimentarius]KRL32572.1 hypothetical protein FD33_GL000002 [Companilactobacillus paralimentarius DSM 13238 = JCM 10415]